MYSLINIFLEKLRCTVYLQHETLVNTCYTKEDCQQCFKKQLFLKCWYISIENIYKLLLILTICLTLISLTLFLSIRISLAHSLKFSPFSLRVSCKPFYNHSCNLFDTLIQSLLHYLLQFGYLESLLNSVSCSLFSPLANSLSLTL